MHPAYLKYITTTLGIKAYRRHLKLPSPHHNILGDWREKDKILAENGNEQIFMDITAHEDKDMKPKK